MNISDEIKKLQQLRNEGVLTDEEFVQAKATVLASGTAQVNQPDGADFHQHFQNIQFQNELERLEREWERERERYMLTKYDSRPVPSKGWSLFVTLIVVGFGLFFTISSVSLDIPIVQLLGIVLILFGVGMGVWASTKPINISGGTRDTSSVEPKCWHNRVSIFELATLGVLFPGVQ